jgi:hypothetical protein
VTLALISPLDRLAGLRGPVVGIDLSTARISGCVLQAAPASHARPVAAWRTRTILHVPDMPSRMVLMSDTIANYLAELEAEFGLPSRVGLEVPLAGGNTPLVSFWGVGACYVALGEVFGSRVRVNEWSPSQWKKRATGSGYAPGPLPEGVVKGGKGAKAVSRKQEKTRLGAWARDEVGYAGTIEDEQDATGVAVAEALLWMGR